MTRTSPRERLVRGIVRVDYPNYHRYKIDGKWAIGVTTALKGIPKDDALKRWAARLVAEHAVTNIWDLKRMIDRDGNGPAISYLKELPNERRDAARVRGTEVHALAERYIKGDEIEVPEHLEPYVRGYAAYIEDFNPTTVHEELAVANRTHGYAGTLDSIQDIPALGRVLVDYKTSNGIYGEYALQVAAYRHAEVFLDADGVEQPMIPVDAAYILHIQPDDYQLIPVQADGEAFAKYLAAQANYVSNVQGRKLDKLIGAPLTRPVGDAA
ncbi:hypothetical protein SAMN05216215_10127 [Saccharopolyspora shandongensis]|uniref:PD-(D/E)XK nuclease superfamily protein n=1 Tax=Saccharopolyspora shandongensis TaxID=418495 RepID=A0A1H3CGJ8_9PSEU|nr:hypothetical protein [Saccharopolyspora shandongensis]SDX52619.1 hypothetical protein SAMN05216215_10127 [Saccharopolyspora shandongensis]